MSTEMVVSEVCNDIITNIENEEIICSIFLDLQKPKLLMQLVTYTSAKFTSIWFQKRLVSV